MYWKSVPLNRPQNWRYHHPGSIDLPVHLKQLQKVHQYEVPNTIENHRSYQDRPFNYWNPNTPLWIEFSNQPCTFIFSKRKSELSWSMLYLSIHRTKIGNKFCFTRKFKSYYRYRPRSKISRLPYHKCPSFLQRVTRRPVDWKMSPEPSSQNLYSYEAGFEKNQFHLSKHSNPTVIHTINKFYSHRTKFSTRLYIAFH